MQLDELTIEKAAKEMAGNWRDFHCFVWFRDKELEDPDAWAIVYTSNRDSGLLDHSNAQVIAQALEPFTEADDPDVVVESHSHWAVGHVDGFSIRVFRNGQITEAFKVYHELAQQMADYPILDESDYSERELDATFENLPLAAWRLKNDYELPEGWEPEVYSWLSDHRCSALENTDDQGGYPDEEDLEAAFDALGYQQTN
ncbi:MAG TPA: hypothetical protein VGG64_04535 [Pirellulales bacterium]|jgi:hypothetical protein